MSELCYTAVTWQFVCYVSNRVTIIISKCARIAITRCNQQLMTSTKLHEYESRVTQTTTEYMTEIAKGNLVAIRCTTHSIPNTIFEKRLVTEKVTSRHFPPACGVMHSRMVSTNTVRLVLFLGETLLQQLLYSGWLFCGVCVHISWRSLGAASVAVIPQDVFYQRSFVCFHLCCFIEYHRRWSVLY